MNRTVEEFAASVEADGAVLAVFAQAGETFFGSDTEISDAGSKA